MKIKYVIHALLLLLLWAGTTSAAEQAAHEAVRQATDELLAKFEEIQPLYEKDKEKFFAEVETSLAPFVDFEGFSRGVMAKYYRRASEEQRKRFVDKFRNSLVRTYADALVGFDNQKVEVVEPRKPSEGDRASVEVKIHGSDGKIYPVDYTMIREEGKWKLRNLVVNGINLGLQFRSQFSAYMQKYNGDMEKVIKNWDVDVRQE